MSAIEAFAKERQRHDKLGYTTEHDTHHPYSDFIRAAQCYAAAAALGDVEEIWDDEEQHSFTRAEIMEEIGQQCWPWELSSFKPSIQVKRNLEKSGALLAAAYDHFEGSA